MGSCEQPVPWPSQEVEASRVDARGLTQRLDTCGGKLVDGLPGEVRWREARDISGHWLALPDLLCSATPHDDGWRREPNLHSCPDIDSRFVGMHIAFVFCSLTFS